MKGRLVQRVVLIAGLLFCTLAAGTVGFRLIEGYTWFEAFYRTLTTITTVGDQQARALDHGGRVFNALVILFGVTAMFLAVGAMTPTIIELELADGYSVRRRRRLIEGLEGHIIVCGYGRVGRNASYELARAQARFMVLDRDAARVAKVSEAGTPGLVADATKDDSLRAAGVLRAKGLRKHRPRSGWGA